MKRILTILAVILISFVLQTTVFKSLALAEVSPNLLLILTVAFGYMGGEKEGIWVGLLCGLLMDVFFGSVLGLYALILMVIGYLNGLFNKLYYTDDLMIPLLLISTSDLLYNFFYYIAEFLLRGRIHILFYLKRIMLPELVYTVLLAVILYRLLHSLYRYVSMTEKREDKKNA
ncbi:MAG: rod shape-determining protein MreD [Clostridiales bacterium]|nr:rod shape-determining protein MreD [Clostridiales bacterium]